MRPEDTDPEAWAVFVEAHRRLGPAGRGRVMLELCDAVREVTRGGIRARHPEYDAHMVERALVRLLLGDELFTEACPGERLLPP